MQIYLGEYLYTFVESIISICQKLYQYRVLDQQDLGLQCQTPLTD